MSGSEAARNLDKLGYSLSSKATSNVAVDAVIDRFRFATTYREKLRSTGVMFCFISEAGQNHPE